MEATIVELDYRRGADIEVRLLWDRRTDELAVIARDDRTGEVVRIPVAHDQAMQAFRHPYAYARSARVG